MFSCRSLVVLHLTFKSLFGVHFFEWCKIGAAHFPFSVFPCCSNTQLCDPRQVI